MELEDFLRWHDLLKGEHVTGGDEHSHDGLTAKIKHGDLIGAGILSHEEIDKRLGVRDKMADIYEREIERTAKGMDELRKLFDELPKDFITRASEEFLAFPQKLQPIPEDVIVIEDRWDGWAKKHVKIGTLPFSPQGHEHEGGGGGVTDHGLLTGLEDDDHLQYHTDTRAATWHSSLSGAHVTGGDSHDHDGGDGAQIAHGSLSGLSSDHHTQYHTDLRAGTWHASLTGSHVTNGDSHDHNGGDGAQIPEGGLSLSDVTTGNVNTSRHGFCPKAPNDTSQFLRGDGSWAVPPGGGGGTPSDTVASETSFGQSASAGTSSTYSRGDHTHGTPADPVPTHAALTTGVHGVGASNVESTSGSQSKVDTHNAASTVHASSTNLEKTSNREASSGYAGLDANSRLTSLARLPLATSDGQFLVRRSGAMSYDTILDADIPSTIARDSEVTSAITSHDGSATVHSSSTNLEKIANKGAANGYASLNASSLVVQNPANATSTPTASKIPISDASAKLDGWVSDASSSAKGLVQLTGQLGGSATSPTVTGIRETGGPTNLSIGSIPDGYYLMRSGSSIVGSSGGGGGGDNISVNGSAAADADFDDTTPSPPAGGANVHWQKNSSTPNDISAYHVTNDFMDMFRRRALFFKTDFLGPSGAATVEAAFEIDLSLISSGTQAKVAATANHPGILSITSSTTANSGAYCRTAVDSFLIGGGECFEIVFQHCVAGGANTTFRMGYLDTGTSTDATDGVYFEIAAGGLSIIGKTASNSTRSSTSSLATLSVNTWYRGLIVVNSDASRVDYYVYNDSGTLVGSGYLTTNIPTGSGRQTGAGFVVTNSGTTATLLAYFDYMAAWMDGRALTR